MKREIVTTRDGKELEYLRLDYDEELGVARVFCKILDRIGIEDYPSVYDKLVELFIKKSFGHDFLLEEFQSLVEAIDVYNQRWDPEWAAEHGLPDPIDALNEKGEKIEFGFTPTHAAEMEDYKTMYRREIARAWKEAWDEHPRGYLRERFEERFPGDDFLNPPPTAEDRWEKDQQLESEFWDMVDEKQEYFECSRHQAILEVSDYMPRAQFDENRMADPNPLKVVKPVIDIDQFAKDRGMEVAEWEKEGEYDDKELKGKM